MLDYTLSSEQLDELRAAHRGTQDKREADRIKAVVALATAGRQRKWRKSCKLTPIPCVTTSSAIASMAWRD